MSDPENYTVGWICAIPTEYTAARQFLDCVHSPPKRKSQNDDNAYTLGEIAMLETVNGETVKSKTLKHNVVVAVLPSGEYGLVTASKVASDMMNSFKNIRIVLLVAIAGGAPTKMNDIRLGDIVVGIPSNNTGGVYQYDYGKHRQGKRFEKTGSLNQPQTILLTAVNDLKSRFQSDGHDIDDSIKAIFRNKEKLKKLKKGFEREFSRPAPDSDRLYQSNVQHSRGYEDDLAKECTAVCGTKETDLVQRTPRSEEEDNPVVHYGTIASANTLMKDALLRDELAQEKGVLCFEMEAAGLMNTRLPALVIRGICDYADSHKNKTWQGYAAMAAASYAQKLLERMVPNDVENQPMISQVLEGISNKLDAVNGKLDTSEARRHKKSIKKWLAPLNQSTNHNKALQQRQDGTGLWFLESEAFSDWKRGSKSFLALHGISGCGKTILSSTIIEDLQRNVNPSGSLLYFYFDFRDRDKRQSDSVLRTLVYQLYHTKKLQETLLAMTDLIGELTIVIDALDEAPALEDFLIWMKGFFYSARPSLHLLVTSRAHENVTLPLSQWTTNEQEVQLQRISIQSEDVDNDIRKYVREQIQHNQGLARWRSRKDVQEEMEDKVMEKAGGMFRWAKCQIDALSECIDYPILVEALSTLPNTLDETYERILEKIPVRVKKHVIIVLQFLMWSYRPVELTALVDAVAVNLEKKPEFEKKNRLPDSRDILIVCSSLVTEVKRNGYGLQFDNYREMTEVRLAHLSVKEYLESTRLPAEFAGCFKKIQAHASITRICLRYLSSTKCPKPKYRQIHEEYPLAGYSAIYWGCHLEMAGEHVEDIFEFANSFLHDRKASFIFHVLRKKPHDDTSDEEEPSTDPTSDQSCLSTAIELDSDRLVQFFLQNTHCDINAVDDNGDTALFLASQHGRDKTVQRLLNNGADVNKEGSFGTPLQVASSNGCDDIVQWLLMRDIDVDAKGKYFGTALQAASNNGHSEIVGFLLGRGADVDLIGGNDDFALRVACLAGHCETVKILLDARADVNLVGGSSVSALQTAASTGHANILQMLLDKDADDMSAALHAAIFRDSGDVDNSECNGSDGPSGPWDIPDHSTVIEILLNKLVDVSSRPLYLASPESQTEMVRLLMDQDLKGALEIALSEGYWGIIEALREIGADECYSPPRKRLKTG